MDGTGSTEHVPYARVTVAEAAAIFGVNVVTIRRMIKRGQLEAERVHRPQGSAYLVTLPGHAAADGASMEQSAQDMSRTHGIPGPAADAMVSLIQTTIATVLGPLVGQLDAQRQTIERQAEQLTSQAETIGRQSERVAGLETEIGSLSAELRAERLKSSLLASTAPQSPESTNRDTLLARLRALAPWLLAALITLVALLAWPR
jgi:excisionase family DNA binding protein